MRASPRSVRVLSGLLLVLALASGCATPQVAAVPAQGPASPAVAASAASQGGFVPEFAVLQLNDVYRIGPVGDGSRGGLARVSGLIDRTRAETGLPVYLVHAGDFLFPSMESQYWSGAQMTDALNFLHQKAPLVVVPGNHEFEQKTAQALVNSLKATKFPWVGANLKLQTGDAEADAKLAPEMLVRMGTLQVGFFGITLDNAFGGKDRDYAPVEGGYEEIARQRIESLEQRGADVIIGLTHLYMETDVGLARLRQRYPKFLWIAGGHDHSLQSSPSEAGAALVTKGDSNAVRIWRILVGRKNGAPELRAETVEMDTAVPVDEVYQREVWAKYLGLLREKLPFIDTRIGMSAVPLDAREEPIRNRETAYGNFLTDLMRTAFPKVPTDIAVLNGGAIRLDDVVQGELRFEHLLRTFGFPTRVGLVWLKGVDVRRMLEQSVSGGRGEGRFLQVSGLRFTFDRSRPTRSRVLSVEVEKDGKLAPLDDAATYVVAVPDYIFDTSDGYDMVRNASQKVPYGPDLKLMAFEAISRAYADNKPLEPKLQGRITEVGVPSAPAAGASP
jgi:5'-nucleotidase